MKRFLIGVVAGIAALVAAPLATADGTETLGPPSVPVAAGTSFALGGVGMHAFPDLANTLNVSVPAGATVKQVLLYWEGHFSSPAFAAGDNTISVNGIPVTGTLIGGPTAFFTQSAGSSDQTETFSAYRADITGLNLVTTGANALTINNMLFASNFPTGAPANQGNDGVGILVIYDNGIDSAVVGVRDGLDLAYKFFAPPLDTTVAQTFTFSPAASDRPGNLGTLAAGVKGPDNPRFRGSILRLTFDVGGTVDITNPWQSLEGFEFDALNSAITIPANSSSLTVRALSEGPFDADNQPASFSWIAATLSIQNPPRPGADGCTPGFWKNWDGSKSQPNAWLATGFSQSQLLSSVFSPAGLGTLGGNTLRQALDFKGGSTLEGKKEILLRAAVAALLNSAHPDVAYPLTTAQVIAQVNAALESNDATTIINLATDLDKKNNGGCTVKK